MTAREAGPLRDRSTDLSRLHPDKLMREVPTGPSLFLPAHHAVHAEDVNPARLGKIVRLIHEHQPTNFEALIGLPGVGGKTVRSLALLAELIYGLPSCRRDVTRRWTPSDPATFSYAHGGKDGHPFPVDKPTYDESIALLESAVRRAKADPRGKDQALFRLSRWLGNSQAMG
jgi:hypothetical protein